MTFPAHLSMAWNLVHAVPSMMAGFASLLEATRGIQFNGVVV